MGQTGPSVLGVRVAALALFFLVGDSAPTVVIQQDEPLPTISRIHIPTTPSPGGVRPTATVALPAQLVIPVLGVNTKIERVGLEGGNVGVPVHINNVGWYTGSVAPGATGDALIDGHRGYPNNPLVFGHLDRLKVGAQIIVISADGVKHTFTVLSARTLKATARLALPAYTRPHLTLITCSGAFRGSTLSYADRYVVEAEV